ncbi:hypothetical protein SAMN05216315_14216 [Nitrosospira sp. Nsp18]|nr:hypothetical protein SAMN05216315_14216 [Nitrosospira sp. Nsp18]
MLTPTQRCSPKLFTEQLTQQLYIYCFIAKLFKLFRSLDTLSNLLNMPIPLSTLSNFAETRMNRGSDKDAQMSALSEQVGRGGGVKVQSLTRLDRLLNRIFTCGSFRRGVLLPALCRRLQCCIRLFISRDEKEKEALCFFGCKYNIMIIKIR